MALTKRSNTPKISDAVPLDTGNTFTAPIIMPLINTFIDNHNFSITILFDLRTQKYDKNCTQTEDFTNPFKKWKHQHNFHIFAIQKQMKMTQQQDKVVYPQNFDIKLIISAEIAMEEAKQNISRALSDSQTVHSFVNVRSSGKGNYLSYCYNIDIESKDHLERTYALLRTIPGLKFAL